MHKTMHHQKKRVKRHFLFHVSAKRELVSDKDLGNTKESYLVNGTVGYCCEHDAVHLLQ